MSQRADTNSSTSDLDGLKLAMKALTPSGAGGFEGLLAVVLTKISGQDFRLARSGLQNGKDGATLGAVAFEAKRYDKKIPDDQVFTKVFRVGAAATPPHLWILGATVEVGTQLADTLTVGAHRLGVGVLMLDWPDASPLPPLALACAMAPTETLRFLLGAKVEVGLIDRARISLNTLSGLEGFAEAAAQLSALLREPSLALPNGLRANRAFLRTAFEDRHAARLRFGQGLAPGANYALPTRDRTDLSTEVQSALMGAVNGEVVALLGREGHGKSWLFAQAWLDMAQPPLTALVPARSLGPSTPFGQVLPFVISRFIEQTEDLESDAVRERWKTKIENWTPRLAGEPPRFILFMDGMNENPGLDWPRWLAKASGFAADHGGVVAISARQGFFADRVRGALAAPVTTIKVPEWSEPELLAILEEHGIDAENLSAAVRDRLRNPRLLGIAFDLLAAGAITTFAELTIDRLLFEHIRVGAQDGATPEPVDQFVKRLARHAQEVTDRILAQKREDQLVFDQAAPGAVGYELTPELAAVTAEHFFRPLPEDPTQYTLSDEGLSLALGFSLVKSLQRAERNGGDVGEALGGVIDPIAALDKTGDAAFSALLAASIDDRVSDTIRSALIVGLVSLQNIDDSLYPAFVGIVRHIPSAAVQALRTLVVREGAAFNKDWVLAALREVRDRPECWSVMAPEIQTWLRTYSLEPSLSVFQRRADDPQAHATQVETSAAKLTRKLEHLPPVERAFLATLTRDDDVDPSDLHRAALALLAGMPLEEFAEALVACAYTLCLHSSLHDASDDYRALLRFNEADWAATRTALLEALDRLNGADASETLKWTRVEVLRGTSTLRDADEEAVLVEELTADREHREGWRLVEDYSPSDPCDPESVQEGDLSRVLTELDALEIDKVSSGRWVGQADRFLDDAGPALARFAPEQAIAAQRRILKAVLDRPPEGNRIAVTSMRLASAAFDTDGLERLRALAISLARPDYETRPDRDLWLMSQYALLMLLPHLDGDAQVELLSSLPPTGTYLTTLQDVFAPCRPERLDEWLIAATEAGEESQIALALVYARKAGIALSPASWTIIDDLLTHPKRLVRALALGMVASDGDAGRLGLFAATGWSAQALDKRKHFYEIWFGSWALIRAAEHGVSSPEAIVDRLAPGHLKHLLARFGAEVRGAIARRLFGAVAVMLLAEPPERPPAVEQPADRTETPQGEPPRFSLSDEEPRAGGLKAFARTLDQTDDEFEAEQRKAWAAFGSFEKALSKEDARLVIENVGFECADAMVEQDPAQAMTMARAILGAPSRLLPAVANIGLLLARALSARDGAMARDLFLRLDSVKPYLRLKFGLAAVPLHAEAIWRSADTPDLVTLRRSRLDAAGTDHAIAIEVQAALDAGRQDELDAYAEACLADERPMRIARGLMVLGFSLESDVADRAFETFRDAGGVIGKAVEAARFAYDRNNWARTWRDRMGEAERPADVWRYSILMAKIIDGRSRHWPRPDSAVVERAGRFAPTFREQIKRRVGRWKTKREASLMGGPVPSEIYLEHPVTLEPRQSARGGRRSD